MQCLYYLQKQKKCGKRSFGGKGNALLLTIAYVIGYRIDIGCEEGSEGKGSL